MLALSLCLLSVAQASSKKSSSGQNWQQVMKQQQQQQQQQLKQQQQQQQKQLQEQLKKQQAEQARLQQQMAKQAAERQRQMQLQQQQKAQQLKQTQQKQPQQQTTQQRDNNNGSKTGDTRTDNNSNDDNDKNDDRPRQAAQGQDDNDLGGQDIPAGSGDERQARLQRELKRQRELQHQIQQRVQQQQQQLQQRAQQLQKQPPRKPDNIGEGRSANTQKVPLTASPDAGRGGMSAPVQEAIAKHNERSRNRHRPTLPETALEIRPAPVSPPRAGQGATPNLKPAQAPLTAGAGAVPLAAPPLGSAGLANSLPPSRANQQTEIAASHLTTAEIEKAKALGFQPVGETLMPLSNTSVQQLRAPAGIGASQAREMLLKQMPLGKFAVNHTYHIFKDQEGGADRPAAGACANGACVPATLINWSSSLRSCTKDVRIGIIDTSFDLSHPAFRELKVSSGQFLGGENPSPHDWHGTAVLSLLAGDPHSGTPGLVPDAHFLLATAFKTDAKGNASTDSIRLVAALEWLEKLDVKYVNMSFSGPRDPMVETVIQRMRRDGVVFIAAAGNQGPVAPPSYPAAYPDVIAVTAVNQKGENYRHANRGTYIDVSAPGVDVLAALPDGKAGYRTGTSFAAPFVTAIVATQQASSMVSKAVWKPELLSHMQLRDLGPPGPDPIYGQGLALAPPSCTPQSDSTITAGNRPRKGLPPPMGAGGPTTIINTSSGAEGQ